MKRFLLFIALLLKNKSKASGFAIRLMFIVLVETAINCLVTGALIFPQPRYMCYGMGLFYLAIVCGIVFLMPDKVSGHLKKQ